MQRKASCQLPWNAFNNKKVSIVETFFKIQTGSEQYNRTDNNVFIDTISTVCSVKGDKKRKNYVAFSMGILTCGYNHHEWCDEPVKTFSYVSLVQLQLCTMALKYHWPKCNRRSHYKIYIRSLPSVYQITNGWDFFVRQHPGLWHV